jgi:putative transposase
MVGPQAKRQAVEVLETEHGIGVTRACGLVNISRSLYRYRSRRQDSTGLRERLGEIAAEKRRYGYRRIHVLLRREGWTVNKEDLPAVSGDGTRGATPETQTHRSVPACAAAATHSPEPELVDGFYRRRARRWPPIALLGNRRDYSRECLAIEVDTSITGTRVAAVLERLAEGRGLPASITVDHGPEFEGRVLDAWAYAHGLRLSFIRPGKPVENAYIESFNGKFRDECLNEHWFITMAHARRVIERWRIEYNTERPHSSLGDRTPVEYAAQAAEGYC